MTTTEDRIVDAALKVFLEEGLRGATTRRIAHEAGVNEVTLFRHFGSKERLLVAALNRNAILPSARSFGADPRAELVQWAQQAIVRLWHCRGLIHASMECGAHDAIHAQSAEGPARLRRELTGWFEGLRASGRTTGDWDAGLVAKLLMGGLFGEVMRPDAPTDPSELGRTAEGIVGLVMRAVGYIENIEDKP